MATYYIDDLNGVRYIREQDSLNSTILSVDKTLSQYNLVGNYGIYTVRSIAENAFRDCVNVTEITIPDTIETINNYAFYGCSKLTKITLPSALLNCNDPSIFGLCPLSEVIFNGKVIISCFPINISNVYLYENNKIANLESIFTNIYYYTIINDVKYMAKENTNNATIISAA